MNSSSSAELTAWLELNADHGQDKWFTSVAKELRTPDKMLRVVDPKNESVVFSGTWAPEDTIIYRTTRGPEITMFVYEKDPRFVIIQDSRR